MSFLKTVIIIIILKKDILTCTSITFSGGLFESKVVVLILGKNPVLVTGARIIPFIFVHTRPMLIHPRISPSMSFYLCKIKWINFNFNFQLSGLLVNTFIQVSWECPEQQSVSNSYTELGCLCVRVRVRVTFKKYLVKIIAWTFSFAVSQIFSRLFKKMF